MQLNGQIVVFSITIFNDVLGMLIMVLIGGENMELSEIIEMLQREYPEKIVVDLTEYENEDHQTYKFLYEQLDVTHTQKMNEFGLVISDMQQFTKENAELEEQNRTLKEQLDKMNSSVWQLLDQFKNQVNREIVVSDVKTSRKFDQKIDAKSFMQTISTTPGIYGGKRPSWYTPLKRQLSRENMKRKNVSNTIGTLKNKFSTIIVVPSCAPVSSLSKISPASATSFVPKSSLLVLEIIVSFATDTILANASPLKPIV